MNIWVILLAAGEGRRLKKDISVKKQYLFVKGSPLFFLSAKRFTSNPLIKGMIFVLPEEDMDKLTNTINDLVLKEHFLLPYRLISGGKRRQESVFNGLKALPPECTHVLIHDGARPFVSFDVINNVVLKLSMGFKAVIPSIPVTDTIKFISEHGVTTIPREKLRAVQTPQGFLRDLIVKAHQFAMENNISATDDASVVEALGEDVLLVEGDAGNIKITTKEDLKFLMEKETYRSCIGFGYDVHRYGEGKPLKLAGVKIPKAPEVIAHSDGDVVVHSLVDAILGCLAQGDIGELFPDSEDKFKDLNSFIFLSEVMEIATRRNFIIEHVDITIVCEVPKISPYKEEMKKNLAPILHIDRNQINISATTEEGLGFTGEKKGIKVKSVVIGKIP